MPLAQDLCLLLAQEPVPHLDVPGADFLHPGHGRSPAPASSPNCLRSKKLLGSTGWSIPTSKGTVREQLFPRPVPVPRPCRCMAQSQHKTSCGRPPPAPGELSEGVWQCGGGPRACRQHVTPLPKSCCPQDTARAGRGAPSQQKELGTFVTAQTRQGQGRSSPVLPSPEQPCRNRRGRSFPQPLVTARSHIATTETGDFSSWN